MPVGDIELNIRAQAQMSQVRLGLTQSALEERTAERAPVEVLLSSDGQC